MNYETAKLLKDAGFPQDFDFVESIGHTMYPDVHFPTLSELIDACGNKTIHIWNNENIQNSWKAQASFNGKIWQMETGYLTPEEAVAKLWLELNKK